MADFSKQWAELYDPKFPWDFDIETEAEAIPKGYYKPMICEGFGFIAIEVGLDGNTYLIFDVGNNEIDKIEYNTFIQRRKLKSDGI